VIGDNTIPIAVVDSPTEPSPTSYRKQKLSASYGSVRKSRIPIHKLRRKIGKIDK
jgi:hypothetical protein